MTDDRATPWSVALTVPATPAALSIVRLFVASVARHIGLEAEASEDVKLVATELCTSAIEDASGSGGTFTIEVRSTQSHPLVTLSSSEGTFRGLSDEQIARAQLLEAISPALRVSDDGRAAEFVMSNPAYPVAAGGD